MPPPPTCSGAVYLQSSSSSENLGLFLGQENISEASGLLLLGTCQELRQPLPRWLRLCRSVAWPPTPSSSLCAFPTLSSPGTALCMHPLGRASLVLSSQSVELQRILQRIDKAECWGWEEARVADSDAFRELSAGLRVLCCSFCHARPPVPAPVPARNCSGSLHRPVASDKSCEPVGLRHTWEHSGNLVGREKLPDEDIA